MTRRYAHLDGLRGIAALLVMIYHGLLAFDCALLTGLPENSVTSWDVWLSGAPFLIPMAGNLSVCLFFAMSGFVLISVFDAAPLGFLPLLAKRYVRLAIPTTCACLFGCLLLSSGWMANHQVSTITRSTWWLGGQYRQAASFIRAFQEGSWDTFFHASNIFKTYDSSLWTMRVELAGSAGILLICFTVKRLARAADERRLIYIGLFAMLYGVFAESYLGLFAAGALARQILPRGWAPLNTRPPLSMAICVIGLFFGTIPISPASWRMFHVFPDPGALGWMPWPVTGPMFWHMIGAIMILVGLQSSQRMQGVLKSPACQWLGSVSFPLYLIHIPILMTLGCHAFLAANALGVPHKLCAALALAIFVAFSLLCAQVFTLLVERPAIRFSGRLASTLQSATAPIVHLDIWRRLTLRRNRVTASLKSG